MKIPALDIVIMGWPVVGCCGGVIWWGWQSGEGKDEYVRDKVCRLVDERDKADEQKYDCVRDKVWGLADKMGN